MIETSVKNQGPIIKETKLNKLLVVMSILLLLTTLTLTVMLVIKTKEVNTLKTKDAKIEGSTKKEKKVLENKESSINLNLKSASKNDVFEKENTKEAHLNEILDLNNNEIPEYEIFSDDVIVERPKSRRESRDFFFTDSKN